MTSFDFGPTAAPRFAHDLSHTPRLTARAWMMTATALLGALAASPLAAQVTPPATPLVQPGTTTPAPFPAPAPLDPETAARLAAQRQLTEALGWIAADSSNAFALSQAGRAALVLGDGRAAAGFLVRAEALNSRDPTIKAALGAAMVLLEDPQAAMRYFDSAVAAGGLDRAYLGDRGLAFDLMGNQARAQADYAVAIQSNPSAELTRRYALSLGIAGQADQAIQMLGPLLRTQDRAAWRSRALILAMNGRADEARQIARATMPAQLAQSIEPYFGLMDRLTPVQLAYASHFGRFPSYEVVRAQPQRTQPVRVAAATPAPAAATSGRNRGRDRASSRNRTTTENDPRPASRADARSSRGNRRTAATPSVAAPVVIARADPAIPSLTSAPPPPVTPTTVARPMVQTAVQPTPPAATPPSAPATAMVAPPLPTAPQRMVPPPATAPVTAAPVQAPAAPTSPSAPVSASVPLPTVGPVALPPSNVASPTSVQGPPDTQSAATPQGPGFASLPPVAPPVTQPAMSAVPDTAPAVDSPVRTAEMPSAAPPPPAAPTSVLPGWSLDSVVQSLEVPEAERAATAPGLSLAEIEAIAAERRRVQGQQAAEARARARAQAEARAREQAETQARERAEAEAERRAEQERLRRQPARIWYQIATGSGAAALAYDCRRLQRQYQAAFAGQSCSTAAWNRSQRLLVGPFRNAAAARDWGAAYVRAGGSAGFIWNSDAGEEVTPVARR